MNTRTINSKSDNIAAAVKSIRAESEGMGMSTSTPRPETLEGATSAESPEIEARPDDAELVRASAALNQNGVRIMMIEGVIAVGIWSDLDCSEIRTALAVLGMGQLPVLYLDGARVPIRYKVRRVKGEPVPMSVLAVMERETAEPWKARDRMLKRNR